MLQAKVRKDQRPAQEGESRMLLRDYGDGDGDGVGVKKSGLRWAQEVISSL